MMHHHHQRPLPSSNSNDVTNVGLVSPSPAAGAAAGRDDEIRARSRRPLPATHRDLHARTHLSVSPFTSSTRCWFAIIKVSWLSSHDPPCVAKPSETVEG